MTEKKFTPILLLDFDGVIHSYESPWVNAETIPDEPVDGAMDFIVDAQAYFKVAIYSSRSKTMAGITAMQRWLYKHLTAEFGAPTARAIIAEIDFPTEKPPAFLTIDDRCLCFVGQFPDPEQLLKFRPWNKG